MKTEVNKGCGYEQLRIEEEKLIEFLTDKKPPLKFADIVLMLDVKPSEKDLLQKMLDEAVQEGILKVNKRGVYRPSRETNLKGIYLHKRRIRFYTS